MVAVEQRLEYKREVLAGDVITIRSIVHEVRNKSIHFAHEMTLDETNELAAWTSLSGVCIDTSTRKARLLPNDIRDRAEKMILPRGASQTCDGA